MLHVSTRALNQLARACVVQVSVLSYGFWATFGVKSDLHKAEGIEKAKACLRTARANGVNLFDNAEASNKKKGSERGHHLPELVTVPSAPLNIARDLISHCSFCCCCCCCCCC